MKKVIEISVLKYKGKVISAEALNDGIYDNIVHGFSSVELSDNDFTTILSNENEYININYGGTKTFINFGECEVQHYSEHLKNLGFDKMFKHEIISKTVIL